MSKIIGRAGASTEDPSMGHKSAVFPDVRVGSPDTKDAFEATAARYINKPSAAGTDTRAETALPQ